MDGSKIHTEVRRTVKLTDTGMQFLDRFRTNRRKEGTDKRDSPNWKLEEIIYQWFKKNDKEYQDLLKLEWIKNG